MRKIENLRAQKAQLEAKVQDYVVQINYLEQRISSLEKNESVLQNQNISGTDRTK